MSATVAGDEIGSVLQFAPFQSSVDEGFWHRLSSLKLNKLGIDESPIPVTGFYAPCSHSQVSNHLTLVSESFPHEPSENSSVVTTSSGNRNRCPVPGTLYNTNTLEGFYALDKPSLLKAEAKKIWEDIHSGKAELDSTLLSRFLIISFADLKKWSFHYWFAFPAPVLDLPAIVTNLRPASQCLSLEEAKNLSTACNEWRSSRATTDVPFFLVSIGSESYVDIKHLKDWKACESDSHKFLFGFYDPCHLPNNPGWPLRNYLALIFSRWNLEKVDFFCYRESRGFADLNSSLIGEARISVSQGAGTLGCQVAQMLMAWGVRKITLVDSGKVAMSNPLRQSLYTLNDCLNGGEFKATAAVKSLKRIFPAVEAEGVVMAIPMPGHPVSSQEESNVLDDCKMLFNLINSHDAVFLLTDTRESRWLPTLLCANANKEV